MAARGIVRWWSDDQGWGVVDSSETPGGCFVSFAHVARAGYRTLSAGEEVDLEWEEPGFLQDGYPFRALRVWPAGLDPVTQEPAPDLSGAYRSTLSLTFDDPPADRQP